MIEELILETKQRHSRSPISQEEYDRWRKLKITKRLFEDLELSVIDRLQDYLPENSTDDIVIQSMLRQGAMQTIDQILDWSPSEVEGPNDEN